MIPENKDMDILIEGFGAVGAHVARIFHDLDPGHSPIIKDISDRNGYLFHDKGLPWQELFKRLYQNI